MIRRILLVVALVAPTSLALSATPVDAGTPCATSLTVPDTTVGEGDGEINVAVSIEDGACHPGDTLNCTSADGTATAGEDFTAVDTSTTLSEGQPSANVPITITDDEIVEDDEQFTLTCEYGFTGGPAEVSSGGSSGYVFARGLDPGPTDTGTVTIVDNDEAPTTTTTAAPTTTTAAPTTTTAPPTFTISNDNPNPGDDVDLTASGFKGGSDTQIFFLSEPILLTTATADSGGVVRATITIPEDAQPGAHTIEVRGVDSSDTPRTVSIPITVAGEVTDTTAAAQPLAATGSGLSTLILVAGVLAAAGGALLLQVRRRRTAGTA